MNKFFEFIKGHPKVFVAIGIIGAGYATYRIIKASQQSQSAISMAANAAFITPPGSLINQQQNTASQNKNNNVNNVQPPNCAGGSTTSDATTPQSGFWYDMGSWWTSYF